MSQLLIEQIETFLLEKSKHYPFKRKDKIGPGPRKGKNEKKGKWTCSCKDDLCMCDGPDGAETAFEIDKDYKKAYNAEYKKWGPQKKRRKSEKLP